MRVHKSILRRIVKREKQILRVSPFRTLFPTACSHYTSVGGKPAKKWWLPSNPEYPDTL